MSSIDLWLPHESEHTVCAHMHTHEYVHFHIPHIHTNTENER